VAKLLIAEAEAESLGAHLASAPGPATSSELTIAELTKTGPGLDAIHLVAAMELAGTDYLAYDRRQAQSCGFTVIAPGRPDGWYR
jgi:hypothetical protein